MLFFLERRRTMMMTTLSTASTPETIRTVFSSICPFQSRILRLRLLAQNAYQFFDGCGALIQCRLLVGLQ